ncbi:Patatin-like phospholipase [Delftia tsuruhatensis]|uniref:patatin-like phospholipase family protein n=1 Tax=Delftia tsuruhatensis TaxID=180282 RepID=UPI001E7BE2DF|nr:patatin-like phospholipase family protein [Delftia tsuruhatensis]CAB5720217.1 Patatin-like phospholipase [Delftia tsuruhatensis]CAC9685669.1 Patatin-like phospholipase [Delftia tsuruhatensis]
MSHSPALRIHAGPRALAHIRRHGLSPGQVRVIPAAAGGPKGLILGPLDRFIFGEWLPRSRQPVDLVGASIGAWRMATACLEAPVQAFERLERDYIAQRFDPPPGSRRTPAALVSERFASSLEQFYGGRVTEVLGHARYRLHVVAARGRGLLARESRWRTPLGYLGAFASNAVHRKALGAWLERVVFSSGSAEGMAPIPFGTHDLRTRQVALSEANFMQALRASCSIPFVLEAVHDIAGAPRGAYWDGGITDYHLHLAYADQGRLGEDGIVLYPHFQQAVVPGWLDKGLRWRHRATPWLDAMVLLAPDPRWVARLPRGKLPDRHDFMDFATDHEARWRAWSTATSASRQLADEFAQWLDRPDPGQVLPL